MSYQVYSQRIFAIVFSTAPLWSRYTNGDEDEDDDVNDNDNNNNLLNLRDYPLIPIFGRYFRAMSRYNR